jgi:hypothetical protein
LKHAVLRDWLDAMCLDEFRANFLRTAPTAQAATASAARAVFDWEVLDHGERSG